MDRANCTKCNASILFDTYEYLQGLCMPCFQKENYGRTPRQIGQVGKYPCPCCGYYTLEVEPPGSYRICAICFWEDDVEQFHDPLLKGGVNRVSLQEAQRNFEAFGCCEERLKQYVRPVEATDQRVKTSNTEQEDQ